MRIGFDAKRAFHNRSGLGNYSRSLLLSLEEAFYDNEFFLFTPKHKTDIFDISKENWEVITNNKNSLSNDSLWRSFKIPSILKEKKIDIYHGLSNELPFNIKKANVKSIVSIHDLIFLKFPDLYNSIDRKIYNLKFKKSAQNADLIIAISEQTKNDIVNYYRIDENKIKVVYQTCNEAFKIKYSDSQKTEIKKKYRIPDRFILYVGTIEKRKNLLNIIKAVSKHKIDIPIIAVGRKTSYFKEIQNFLVKHPNIQFNVLDKVSTTELAGIYQLAELLVYPSTYEGFGIPIIEALFSEIPVITSNGGCFEEAGGDAALYVNPENIDDIAEKIKLLIKNDELRKNCILKGIEHSKKFDKTKIANELINIYRSL